MGVTLGRCSMHVDMVREPHDWHHCRRRFSKAQLTRVGLSVGMGCNCQCVAVRRATVHVGTPRR